MDVEAGGVEGPVVVVAVGGLEVTRGVERWGVPEATSEVGEEREVGPELENLADENRVVVDGSQGIVEGIVSALYASGGSVYAQLMSILVIFHEKLVLFFWSVLFRRKRFGL